MESYDGLVDPTATELATPQQGLAPRSALDAGSTLVTIDNGKPGGTILLRVMAEAIAERRGVSVERHRKQGASTPYHALATVVRPRTAAVGALGD